MMTFPSWARLGAHVVCIRIPDGSVDVGDPVVGQIYTISRMGWAESAAIISLKELNTVHPLYGECGFTIDAFRPVHTLRSDIRMIKSIVRELPAESRLDRLLEVLNQ